MTRFVRISLVALMLTGVAFAAEKPSIVMDWPSSGQPVLHMEMGKFAHIGGLGKQATYTLAITAENVWIKKIDHIAFEVYIFDKNKTRISQGYLSITNLGPSERVAQTLTFSASGTPATLSLSPSILPKELGPAPAAKTISIQLNSTPSGADIKLDGEPAGTTPKSVRLAVGHHMIEFSHPGFQTMQYPFDVGPDDASGGRLDIDLGTIAHDTLELRDGSVITGDILKMDADSLIVSVAGQQQTIARNRVKRILMVERLPASQ